MFEKNSAKRHDKKLARKLSKKIRKELKKDFSVIFSRTPGASSFRVAVHDGDSFGIFKVGYVNVAIWVDGLESGLSKEVALILFDFFIRKRTK